MFVGFLDLPWAEVAAMFAAFIGAITFFTLVGARMPRFATWIGKPIKDILGVTDVLLSMTKLTDQQASQHRENQLRFDDMDKHILDKHLHGGS